MSPKANYRPVQHYSGASAERVQEFLDTFFAKMDEHGWYLREDRTKNTRSVEELDLLSSEIEEVIRGLTPVDYSHGPIFSNRSYPRDKNPGPLWVFGTTIEEIEVYIKLQLGVAQAPVICVSFHTQEDGPLSYPLRKSSNHGKNG